MKKQAITLSKPESWKKTSLSAAMALAISTPCQLATADTYTFSYTGAFTMLDSGGQAVINSSPPYVNDPSWIYGRRSQITGTLTYDTDTGTGTATIAPFGFFGGTGPNAATATGISFQEVPSAQIPAGETGSLWLTNMLFDWNGTNGIPVSLLWDADGLKAAIAAGAQDGDEIAGPLDSNRQAQTATPAVVASGSAPATDNAKQYKKIPLGVAPVVTTSWDTTPLCGITTGPINNDNCLKTNPIGTFPLLAGASGPDLDGTPNAALIGGSPMMDGAFAGSNATFDFTTMTITGIVDNTPPVIALSGPAIINLAVGDTYVEQGATCVDAVNGINLDSSVVPDSSAVNTAVADSYEVTYDCADDAGNNATQVTRTVNVTAAGIPAITLLGDTPITHEAATPYTDDGAICTDPEEGTLTPTVVNNVDVNVPGPYAITYDCADSLNNPAPTVTRDVTVEDTTAPVVTLAPPTATAPLCDSGTITIEAGDPDPTPTATANDTLDGDLTSNITATGGVTISPDFNPGQLSQDFGLAWNVDDAAGNAGGANCIVTVGRPEPVATLKGNASDTAVLNEPYIDPGATCEDFKDGLLADATTSDVIDTSLTGDQTINYTCGPDSDNNTGNIRRTVRIPNAGELSAPPDSQSSFVLITTNSKSQTGEVHKDITVTWDRTLNTSVSEANFNMTLASAGPKNFFGDPYFARDIRVFGPGTYTFDVDCVTTQIEAGVTDCPISAADLAKGLTEGRTLTIEVGQNQLGAHMQFDWSGSVDIDVVQVWDINGAFIAGGPDGISRTNFDGTQGVVYNLVSADGNGDGIAGVPMVDGPFVDQGANFNINFIDPPFSLPTVQAPILSTTQGGGVTRTVIADSGTNVTITADVGTTFDWSSSDTALLTGGATDQASFTFNPAGIADGYYTAAVVTNAGTDDEASNSVVIQVLATNPGVDFNDDDNDGIPNNLDNSAADTELQLDAASGDSIVTAAGKLSLGQVAFRAGGAGATVTVADTGVTDTGATQSCIGGCFDFEVIVPAGGQAQLVLPLTTVIPAGNVEYRKMVDDQWQTFVVGADTIATTLKVAGACPAPGDAAYVVGLAEGDDCVQLSITDGGPNDADGLPNGIIQDPGGVSIAVVQTTPISSISSPGTNSAGCAIGNGNSSAGKHGEWWLLGGLLSWLGFSSTRKRKT